MPLAGYANANNAAPEVPRPSSVHNTVAQVSHRIYCANERLEKMLARVRGSQPSAVRGNAVNEKAAEEPSVLAHLGNANAELCRLEEFINELSEQVG